MTGADDPHADQPVVTRGVPLDDADAAVVLVHGRGATADDIVGLSSDLPTDRVAVLAPQADADTWYPESFLAPLAENEPRRRSALRAVGRVVDRAAVAGVDPDRVVLCGFSQGACVAADYVGTRPRRYGGLSVLSGGLMGETLAERTFDGDLAGTPVVFACSDEDPYIPEARVHASADVFRAMGAAVSVHIDEGGPHAITDEARARTATLVATLVD